MGEAARIKWNSLFLFLSTIIRIGTNFLLFVGIARLYGPDAFGQFTTAHALAVTFTLLADFGFDSLLATEIARDRSRGIQLARQFFSFKLISMVVATVAMLTIPLFQHLSDSTRLLVSIFSFYVLLSSLNTFFFGVFKGFEELQHETKISFIMNALLFLCMIVFGVLHFPLYSVALLFVGSRLVGIIACLRISSVRFGLQFLGFSLHGWRALWRRVMVFGMHFVFGNLFFILDTILLAFWKTDREVGIYQSVFKIVVLTLIIPDIVVNTTLPVLSRLHGSNIEQWKKSGAIIHKFLFLSALPIAIILFVFADQVISVVYGEGGFVEAAGVLRVFGLVVFVRFIVEPSALMLTTSGRQFMRMVIVVIGTFVNLGLNAYAIPKFGYNGAAVVSLITNIVVGVGYFAGNRLLIKSWAFDLRTLVMFAIAAVSAILLWQLRSVSMFLTAPVFVGLLALVSYYYGLSQDERVLLFARRGFRWSGQ